MTTASRWQSSALILLISTLVIFQCIKRDNVYDPFNGCYPEQITEYQKSYTDQFLLLLHHSIDSLPNEIALQQAEFDKIHNTNDDSIVINKIYIDSAHGRMALNASIEQSNIPLDCKQAQPKLLLKPFNPVRLTLRPGIANQLRMRLDTLLAAQTATQELYLQANAQCTKQIVLGREFFNFYMHLYDSTAAALGTVIKGMDSCTNAWSDLNVGIDSTVRFFDIVDSASRYYSDSINFCKNPITNPADLAPALDNVNPGDTIALNAQQVTISQFVLSDKGSATGKPIVLLGNPSTQTVISGAEQVLISHSHRIILMNFTFTDMKNGVGARITDSSSTIQFFNCRFSGNRRYGFYADYSSGIHLENCRIMHNGYPTATQTDSVQDFGGMRFEQVTAVVGKNMLVAKNNGQGIDIHSSIIDFYQLTVSGSNLNGIQYAGLNGTGSIIINSSLFCYNNRYGIWRGNESTEFVNDVIVLPGKYNRFWENGIDALGGASDFIKANQPAVIGNPDFIDMENDDYRYGTANGGTLKGRNIGYQY